MEAAYTEKTAVVVLDDSEALLIMKALDELRYSDTCEAMTGSELLTLAGLSSEFNFVTADMGSQQAERVKKQDDGYRVILKAIGMVLTPEYWEFRAEDVARFADGVQ